MKRLLMILLCLLMLPGCGKKDSPVDTGEKLPVNQAAEQEIRNALSMLIDRNYIAQSIGQAGQTPADGFVPMGMSLVSPVGCNTKYALSPDPPPSSIS